MKLTFSTRKSTLGTRVYTVDTKADTKAKNKLGTAKENNHSNHNFLTDEPRIVTRNGVMYLDL